LTVALRRFLLLVAAFVLVALVLAAWFLPNHEDFRTENGAWNGLSRLEKAFSFRPLPSLDDLPSTPEGTALVVIPGLDYTSPELERIGRYVSQGGSIILADDYGYGNRVLAYLGLEARFSGQALLDPLINYKNQNFPRVARFEPDPLTDGLDDLVLNHATSLLNVDPADVLALSSPFSFSDENGSGARDAGEPAGPLPVVARQQIGSSQIIFIADPSVFINGMEDIGGNARFIQNVAAASTALYIDQSHLETSDLGRTRGWLEAARRLLGSALGSVLLVAAAVIAAMLPIWHHKPETSTATRFQRLLSDFLERRRA
jgi:hypothetical protein